MSDNEDDVVVNSEENETPEDKDVEEKPDDGSEEKEDEKKGEDDEEKSDDVDGSAKDEDGSEEADGDAKPKKEKPEGSEEEGGEDEEEEDGEEEEGEDGEKKPRKKKKKKKEEPPPPPKKKPPAHAPPPPPPKIYDVDKTTWSTAPVSNRVWEVDEEVDYGDAPQEDEIDLSGSDFLKEFTLGPELGRGFFATVRVATENSSGKKKCVKIITPQPGIPGGDGQFELETLTKLAHPNIVKAEKLFTHDPYTLLVLELAEGGELASVLGKANGYNEAAAQRLAKQLCEAVAQVHGADLIHGDIAPENVLLSGGVDSVLKLGGFSNCLAKDAGNSQLIGNAEYQPPEVMMNQGFDQSADIWSLGCILYYLVQGASPFQDSNSMRMNMKIRQGKFEYGDEWANVSSGLKDLIRKMVVVDPKARISAADVLKDSWITGSGSNTALPHVKANVSS